jgi:hypothetical protein
MLGRYKHELRAFWENDHYNDALLVYVRGALSRLDLEDTGVTEAVE